MTDFSTTNFSQVFAGRERELEQLRAHLRWAIEGSGSFVVISGEAGIGKTTLVNRIAAEARDAGVNVISTSFKEVLAYEPYKPFLQIIKQLSDSEMQKSAGLVANAPIWNDDKHEQHSDWDLESLYSLQKEQGLAQQRLVSVLTETSRKKPLFITLNDVHLAPLTTWKFIHYLCGSLAEQKILLMVTLRQDGRELQKKQLPAYADVLQRMNREGLVDRIKLGRFDEKDIRKLLNKLFPRSDFSSRMVAYLMEATHAIPAQVIRCIEALQQKGVIFQKQDVWYNQENMTKETLINLVNDDHERKAALELTKKLSSNHKVLLQYAALMNRQIDHRLLSAITKRPRITVVKDLLALSDRKILTPVSDGRYEFKTASTRLAILAQIPPEKRITKHHEIAASIEGAEHLESTEKVTLLAHHYSQTEDKKSAFRYLHRAGTLAIENFAFLEAQDFVKKALDLLDAPPKADQKAEKIKLLTRAAWLDRVLGHWDDSIENCKAALKLSGKKSDNRTKNQILIQQGLTYFRLNDWENAQRCFEACHRNKQDLDLFEQAMVNLGLGDVHFELGNYEVSRNYFEEALEITRDINVGQFKGTLLNNLGAVENVYGHRLRAIALYSYSIPIYEESGDNLGLARAYHNIGMTYADEDNWEEANNFYGKSLKASDVMGLRPLKSITFLNRALALAHLKRFDEAREYNFKAQELLKQLKDDLGIAEYHKVQGVIEREQSNWIEAGRHLQLALEKFMALRNKLGQAETEYELGLLAHSINRQENMAQWLNKALESYGELGLVEKVEKINGILGQLQSTGSPFSSHGYN